MNAFEMYHLVRHPTVKNAYTFTYAYRGYYSYGAPAQIFFYDKIIDDRIFVVKYSTTIHFPDSMVVGYYSFGTHHQKFLLYTIETVIKELERQYNVEIPEKHKVVYIDYIRGHVVYNDGTTLKLSHRKIFKIPEAKIVKEYGIDYFYASEEATYATITGAEVLRLTDTRMNIILGYKSIKIEEPILVALLDAKNVDEIKTIINLL